MTDVYVPAFGAEMEWRSPDAASLSPVALHDPSGDDDLDEAMALACADGDFFALRKSACERIGECFAAAGMPWRPLRDPPDEASVRAVPFAVTQRSVEFCNYLGLTPSVPHLDVVRAVNSKIWSAIARERAGAPLGTIAFSSAEAVAQAAALLERGPVILKEAFGVSGSGNLVVASRARLAAVGRVLGAEEKRGRHVEIVVEPFLPKRVDFSSHLMLGADGQWNLIGFQAILNLGTRYLGSRRLSQQDLAALSAGKLMEKLGAIAGQLVEAGYHGPVCIDGLVLADGLVAPIIEINARMSMGLLNLRLSRKLSMWGLSSTLLKVRAGHRMDAPSVIDVLARARLLPKKVGAPAILPVTSGAMTAGCRPREIVVALLYRNSCEEALLRTAMLDAFAAAGIDLGLPPPCRPPAG